MVIFKNYVRIVYNVILYTTKKINNFLFAVYADEWWWFYWNGGGFNDHVHITLYVIIERLIMLSINYILLSFY